MWRKWKKRGRRTRPASVRACETLEARQLLTSLPVGFTEVQVATGIDRPTDFEIAPDGRIFVAEKLGDVRLIQNGQLQEENVLELDVVSSGEHGLVGIVLDPNFQENGYLYAFYTTDDVTLHNRVSRFTIENNVVTPGSELIMIDMDELNESQLHNGGGLAFGDDGKLYIGVGENGDRDVPRSFDSLLGKVLRLNPDGTIPTDNPYYDTLAGDFRAIYARGLRNPFTLAADAGNDRIFVNDVGGSNFEEVNELTAEADYGWPAAEGVSGEEDLDDPFYAYGHGSGPQEGCAVTGGVFYNPENGQFPAEMHGDYFFVDFCGGWINRLNPETGVVTEFATELSAFPAQLQIDSFGALYYLGRAEGGLFKIEMPRDSAPTIALQPSDAFVATGEPVEFHVSAGGSGPLAYQWQRDGVDIPGATNSSLTLPSVAAADNGAQFRAVVTNPFGTVTSDPATVTVAPGERPMPEITLPADGVRYVAGDTIHYAGTATDAEDGTLADEAFTWEIVFHHDDHTHPFILPRSGESSGSFVIPTVGETSSNVWYRIHLSVVDSDGLVSSTSRDIFPVQANLTFDTNVDGIPIQLDGALYDAPHAVVGAAGVRRSLGAPTPAVVDDRVYQFVAWSDGGAVTHEISTPTVDTTYTAIYGTRVVDNADPGYAEEGAGWQTSAATGWQGSSVRQTDQAGASARWTPLVAAGLHRVQFYKVVDPANTTGAELQLVHNGQTTVIPIDLTAGETGWVDLGSFQFDGQGNESLTLVNAQGAGNLTADAVRFHDGSVANDELVAYWKFDEAAGVVALDSSDQGRANHASLEAGAIWSDAGLNGSVRFDGGDAYVDIPDTDDINDVTHDQLSVALWVYLDDVNADGKQVLYQQGGEARGVNAYVDGGQLYVGQWNDSVDGWAGTFLSTAQIASGRWHHVALTINGSTTLDDDVLVGYLDGVEFGRGQGLRSVRHGGDVSLGRIDGSTRFHDGNFRVNRDGPAGMAGMIDEARVYNRQLASDEVFALATRETAFAPLTVTVDPLTTLDTTPELTGTVNDPAAEVSVTVNGATYEAENLGDGRWRLPDNTIDPPLLTGTLNVQAVATLESGDEATDHTSGELTIQPQVDTDAELVAYLSLNEGTGTTAADTSAHGGDNPGQLEGGTQQTAPQWNTLGLGGSLTFDGERDYVDLADSIDINLRQHSQRTIALWFYADDASVDTRKQVLYEHGGSSRGMNIYLDDSRLYIGAWSTPEGWEGTFLVSEPVTSGRWHHVALVLDGTDTLTPGALQGFLDGHQFGTGAAIGSRSHGGDIGLGRVDGLTRFHTGVSEGNRDGLAGMIDELRIYNRPLDVTEIESLAAAQLEHGHPLVSVDVLETFNFTPELTGLVDDPEALVEVTVDGTTYVALNRADGTWVLPEGAINPPLLAGAYDVQATARAATGAVGRDVTANELTVIDPGISEDDLVAYWNFNEGTGDVAADSSPGGQDNSALLADGTGQTSPEWSEAGVSGAVRFDGQADLVDVPDSVDLNLDVFLQRTISLWFQADDVASPAGPQVLYEEGGATTGLGIYLDGGQLYVGGWATRAGWDGTFVNTSEVNSGHWHHVVLTLDGGEAGSLRGYVDGHEIGAGEAEFLRRHAGDIGIGRTNGRTRFHSGPADPNVNGYAGLVDEVRVYNRTLSSQEVWDLHQLDRTALGGHTHGNASDVEIADHAILPEVGLELDGNATDGYRVRVTATNFVFAPEHINSAHIFGEGHAHLHLDGERIATVFGEWYDLPTLEPGTYELSATLQTNLHASYTHHGVPIGAAIEWVVESPQNDGHDGDFDEGLEDSWPARVDSLFSS